MASHLMDSPVANDHYLPGVILIFLANYSRNVVATTAFGKAIWSTHSAGYWSTRFANCILVIKFS